VLSEKNTNPNSANDTGDAAGQQQRGSGQPSRETPIAGSEIHQPETNTKCCNTKDKNKHWLEYATGLFAFIAAIGAIGAAIFGGVQAWVTRDTEKRQLRAYIGINTSVAMHVDNEKLTFAVDNFGQTPANRMRVFSNWEFLPVSKGLPPDFNFSDQGRCPDQNVMDSYSPIFPKTYITHQRLHCAGEFDKLQRAQRKEFDAFLFGHIEYVDMFNKKRRTDFCFLYLWTGAHLCDRHNEIDPPKVKRRYK
jgi:hypothetical protein